MSSPSYLLVLGEAGSGKSTFINKLSGQSEPLCNVSNERDVDGTSKIEGPYACRRDIHAFDTVGLSSNNYSSSVESLRAALEKVNATQVAVILVCRTSTPRWTSWIKQFRDTVALLFGAHIKAIIYWIRDSEDDDMVLAEQMEKALDGINCEFITETEDQNFESTATEIKLLCDRHSNRVLTREPAAPIMLQKGNATPKPQKVEPPSQSKPKQSLKSQMSHMRPKKSVSDTNSIVKALEWCLERRVRENGLFVADKYRGKALIAFEVACEARINDDVELLVKNAIESSALAGIYDLLAKDSASSLPSDLNPEQKSHLVAATMWYLYDTAPKAKKNPYYHLLRLIVPLLSIKAPTEVPTVGTSVEAGKFENYVNTHCGPQKVLVSTIMNIVNEVAHKHPSLAYAEIGGSIRKHTDTDESDIDVFVHCRSTIDQLMRKAISEEIFRKCQELFKDVTMKYKANATTFEDATTFKHADVSFDVVFGNNIFSPVNPRPPRQTEFYNNPRLQRVVRTLKIFQEKASLSFPEVKGIYVEKFVISISDEEESHDDTSGILLVVRCLHAIAYNDDKDESTIKVRTWQTAAQNILDPSKKVCGLNGVLQDMGLTKEFIGDCVQIIEANSCHDN